MILRKLDEFMVKRGGSIDPLKFKNVIFELFSIPSFDQGNPEILEGHKIGSTKKVVEPKDILLSKIVPHIRRCWVVHKGRGYPQIASGEWIQFRSDELAPEYVRHFLISDPFHSQFMRTVKGIGGSLLRANPAKVAEIEIPVPPLDDQIRIAHLLGKVGGLIAQRKQHLQQLDDLLKSVFLEMFGDPVRNEKGWEVYPLGSIGDVQGGLQVTTKRNDYKLDAPYLRVANVYRDRLNLSEIKRIGLTSAELDRVRLQKGDLLIVEGHGNPEEVGRSAVWDGSIENCVHQNHLIRVRVDSSQMTPLYASFFINSPGGRQQMFRAGKTTSGLNTISSRNVKETMVAVPPLGLQNQFAVIAEKVEGIKFRYQQSVTDLEALYGALSQQAFKGELDLSRVPLPDEQGQLMRGEHDEQQKQTDRSPLPVGGITPTEVINHLLQTAQPQEGSELLATGELNQTFDNAGNSIQRRAAST